MASDCEIVLSDCEIVASDHGVEWRNPQSKPVVTVALVVVHSELVDDCTSCTAELLGTRAVGPVVVHTLQLMDHRNVEPAGTRALELVNSRTLQLVGAHTLELVGAPTVEPVGTHIVELMSSRTLELVSARSVELVSARIVEVEVVSAHGVNGLKAGIDHHSRFCQA